MKKTKFLLACALSVCALGVVTGSNYASLCAKNYVVAHAATTVSTGEQTIFKATSGYVNDDKNISFEAKQGSSGTAPAVNSDVIRIYQSGGLLEITANNSKIISKVIVGSSMSTSISATNGSGTSVKGKTSLAENSKITIDNLEDEKIIIKCEGTTKSTRLYLNSLEVEYNGEEESTTEYSVSFDSDGGTAVESQTVLENKKATEPTTPTKDGFKFAGWYTDEKLTTKYDFNSKVTGNVSLKAKWLEYKTVSFDSDGGTAVESIRVAETEKATKPADPTKEGYAFGGWYNGDTEYDFDSAVTDTISLKAKWLEKFSVSFDSNGGSSVESQTIVDGSKATKPTNPTKEGYFFSKWVDAEGNDFDFANTNITGNTVLYAEWTETRKVSFNSNGGSSVSAKEVAKGQSTTSPSNPTKTGYKFAGWYTEGGEAYNFSTPVNENITLYAHWDVKKVSDMTTNGTYAIQGEVTSIYKGNRIYIQDSTGVIAINGDIEASMSDVEVGNIVTVVGTYSTSSSVKLDGAKQLSSISSVTIDNSKKTVSTTPLTSLSNVTSANAGKYVELENVQLTTVSSTGSTSYTLKIKNSSVVIYNAYDCTDGISSDTLAKFANKTVNVKGIVLAFTKNGTTTMEIGASSIEIKHNVTFHYNNGDENKTLSFSDGATFNGISNPKADGKVFMGWYTDEALTKEFDSVTDTMDVYAKYGYDIKTNFTTANTDVSFQLAFGYDKTTKDDGTVVYSNFTGITLRVCVSNDKVSELAADSVGIAVAKDNIVERETKNTTVRAIDFKNSKTQTLDNEKFDNNFIAEVTNISLENCLTYIYFVPYAVGNSCTYVTEEYSICVDSVIDEYLEMDIAEESKVILRALKAAIAEANPEA